MALGGVAAAMAPSLLWLGVVLLLAGLVSAPALIVAYLAADALVPEGGRTEATTWVNPSNNVGVALGAAAAGVIIDNTRTGVAFLAGAFVLAIAAGVVFTARSHLDASEGTTLFAESAKRRRHSRMMLSTRAHRVLEAEPSTVTRSRREDPWTWRRPLHRKAMPVWNEWR